MRPASDPQALIAILPAGIGPERLQRVVAQCAQLGMVASVLDTDASSGGVPRVVVAALAERERRVPRECLQFIEKHAPRASLLLVCEESLIRPSVSLADGRITLVAWSSGIESIGARIRVLSAQSPQGGAPVEECAAARWWAAYLVGSGGTPLQTDESGSLRLAIELDGVSSEEHAASARLELNADADSWRIEWPDVPKTLWLVSAQRLPTVSDLSKTHGGKGPVSVRAASGDVTLAVTRPVGCALSASLKELTDHVSGGGPALFDVMSKRARDCSNGGVLVVEVR